MTDVAIVGGSVDVLVRDGVVVEVGPSVTVPPGASVVDASGLLVAPGFIDLQLNGAHAIDLTEEPERLWEVAASLPRYGVTAFLPTIVTSPRDVPGRALATLARRPDGFTGAEPLGLHFEGPMLNPDRRGAHPSSLLRSPSPSVIWGWSRSAGVAMVTLAPELPGALEVIRTLVAGGVVVSAGHTAATTVQMEEAIDAGVASVTHLFNGMVPFAHREPGPAGVALADPRLTVGLIADGIHVHPTAVAAAWRALGPDRLSLVTDAVAALGLPAGPSRVGGQDVLLDETGVRLPDGTLAGSALSLDQAVRNLVAFTGCEGHDAIATVTATPARLLGLHDVGSLAVGARADLVLLTPGLDVVATVVSGQVAFDSRDVPSWRS
jgi:N-acetylglucosamine-6-phosphate deacetylase